MSMQQHGSIKELKELKALATSTRRSSKSGKLFLDGKIQSGGAQRSGCLRPNACKTVMEVPPMEVKSDELQNTDARMFCQTKDRSTLITLKRQTCKDLN